jgi:chemotaxis protein MotB
MVTFGDLMSLLLTFFVLLLSFSQMDVAKFKALAGSLEQAFGVQRKEPVYNVPTGMNTAAGDFEQPFVEPVRGGEHGPAEAPYKIAAQLRTSSNLWKQGLIELEMQGNYLVMRLLGHTTFDSGKAEIRAAMLPTLQAIGSIVGGTAHDIFVAGHTDNIPTRGGPYRSNLELSVARAAAVVDFFVTQGLVPADKIATMGFGEYRPLAPNDTPENRQKNRRVEIILTASQPLQREPSSTGGPPASLRHGHEGRVIQDHLQQSELGS